jgi:putative ABC transport system permease protein
MGRRKRSGNATELGIPADYTPLCNQSATSASAMVRIHPRAAAAAPGPAWAGVAGPPSPDLNPPPRYHPPVLVYLVRLSLGQLQRYPAQSALAMIGVAIGVANIVMLLSITDIGRRQTTGLIEDFGANLILVAPYFDINNGPMGGNWMATAAAHLPDEVRATVAELPNIEAVASVLLLPGHATAGEKSIFTSYQGIDPNYSPLRGQKVSQGRNLTWDDLKQKAKVVLLGETVRRELFGDRPCLGKQVDLKNELFTVVGVMEAKGKVGMEDVDNRLNIPLTTMQALFGYDGITGLFARYKGITEPQAREMVRLALAKLVNPGENVDEVYTVFTIKEANAMLDNTIGVFRDVLYGISSIALLVAGIGIMNVMLMRIIQRRREIGVRRAVGASRRSILAQFLGESMLLAMAGALLGAALGWAGVGVICRYAQWEPYINPWTLAVGVVFSAGLGMLFGAYPALRAATLDPILCLRSEQ